MRVVMSRARKHAYPSPWPGKTRAACRTQPFGGPRTRVDRLERMSFSVAISRWADVRVTCYVVGPFHGQGSRISSLFFMHSSGDMAPAQSRAASTFVCVGCACMNGSRREGRGEKKKNEMTTEHARSNLGGAHGCMRLWVAVPESPTLLETLMPMSKLIHVHFGRANADEVGAREEGTCLSAHCDT